MKFKKTKFKNVILINPNIFCDNRGYFFEKINQRKFFFDIKQENESLSKKKYTFRGLHFQKKPFAQKKLITVIKGSIIDYVLCINKKDKNFGKHINIKLDDKKKILLFLDENYAHGFLTLEKNTVVNYKVSNFYNKNNEVGIDALDPSLNIRFSSHKKKIILSEKDKKNLSFKNVFLIK
jgi:dTDP-4-dehydrorhamnose 3,5-epimerase